MQSCPLPAAPSQVSPALGVSCVFRHLHVQPRQYLSQSAEVIIVPHNKLLWNSMA